MTENSLHPPTQICYFEGRECMQRRGSVGGCQLPQGSASCLLLFLSQPSSLASAPSRTTFSPGEVFWFLSEKGRNEPGGLELASEHLPGRSLWPLTEKNISGVIESVVENVEGTVEWRQSIAHQTEHSGLPQAFLRPSGALFPLSIKERPWWVLREACV